MQSSDTAVHEESRPQLIAESRLHPQVCDQVLGKRIERGIAECFVVFSDCALQQTHPAALVFQSFKKCFTEQMPLKKVR